MIFIRTLDDLTMAEGGVPGIISLTNLEEQLSKFPAELLDNPCVECHLGKLVHMIDTKSMMLLATDLELSAVEVDDIQTAWPRKPAIQRLEMFKKWQQKKQSQTTYRLVLHSDGVDLVATYST